MVCTKQLTGLVVAFLLLCGLPAEAGVTGHWNPGVEFFNRGTLPPPGFYMKNYFVHYRANALRDRHGNKLDNDFRLRNTTMVNRFIWISNQKFLGADVGLHGIIPLVTKEMTTPRGDRGTPAGLGDVLIEPVLSWRNERSEFAFGISQNFPTGNWSNRPENTITLDCYTTKATLGGTWYLGEAKDWVVGGILRYEVHSRNTRSDISRGDDFTLEWALGKRFWENRVEAGVGGYIQRQITRDEGSDVTWDKTVKDRIYGAGPELKINIPEMNCSVTLNYIQEFGAADRPQGRIYGLSFGWRF